jgi:hypothetical protein
VDVCLAIRVVVAVIGPVLYPEDKWVSNALCYPKAWIVCVSLMLCVAYIASNVPSAGEPYDHS